MARSSGPLRVCFNAFFLQDHLGGIGNYGYHLIKEVRRIRPEWEISLLVHEGTAPHFRSLDGVKLLEKRVRSRNARLAYFHLVFPFQTRHYDLLHSIGNMGMLFCPIRQVITIHDLYDRVSPERFSPAKRFLMRILITLSGRHAAAILTDSESTRRDIARFYPLLYPKTSLVYLGNKFLPTFAAPDRPRRDFIFVGTIEPGKNLAHILEAFAVFRKRRTERLKVVGATGWGHSHIPALLESLGIVDSVDFLGYVPDAELQGIYASSIALIIASNYEGFGLPVIEAMACGCPVISARNSSLVEAGGDSAIFFETGNIPELSAKMEEVYRNGDLRRRCILSGYAHAARFTWEKTAEETVAVYESAGRA
jgi:glycosyltransferase involved in cell wall biosynthesis